MWREGRKGRRRAHEGVFPGLAGLPLPLPACQGTLSKPLHSAPLSSYVQSKRIIATLHSHCKVSVR